MVLDIVKYGDPVLRQKGERVENIKPELTQLIDNMLETMHDAHGIGLAAQQIGRAGGQSWDIWELSPKSDRSG